MRNRQSDIGVIDIKELILEEDGSLKMEFTVDDDFKRYYLRETRKKRVTRKGLVKFVKKLLKNAGENKHGYSFTK